MTELTKERVEELRKYIEDAFGEWVVARVKADLLAILDSHEGLIDLAATMSAKWTCASAELEKVCARNKLMDETFGSLLEKNVNLEAALAKQAPLIEALMAWNGRVDLNSLYHFILAAEWKHREDGYWVLELPLSAQPGPDIKPEGNNAPLSGPRAISNKEVEELENWEPDMEGIGGWTRNPAPSPAPSVERREGHCALKYDKTTRTIKTFDPNPAPLPKEVEEAMFRMEMFANCHGSKDEVTDAAVIQAALSKGVEWERRYAELVETVANRTDQAKGVKP